MPTYVYTCETCGLRWEEHRPLADYKVPCETACTSCGGAIVLQPVAPGIGDPFRLGRIKSPDAFKDILRNIKKHHRHSRIEPDHI